MKGAAFVTPPCFFIYDQPGAQLMTRHVRQQHGRRRGTCKLPARYRLAIEAPRTREARASSALVRLARRPPRATQSTNDALAYFGPPDRFASADEVHVDCTFTYDKPVAERLAEQWRAVAPTR
jgi:hypothetical protein